MNTLESCIIINPFGKEEECAKFIIDDIAYKFTLSSILNVAKQYTLSFWVKSESDGSVLAAGDKYNTSTNWTQCIRSFTADSSNLDIRFRTIGTYYIYHPQLEIGNKSTDWTAAPEDTDNRIDDLDSELRQIIIDQNTSITQTMNEIKLNASETYVTKDDYGEFKTKTETEFSQLPDKIGIQVSRSVEQLIKDNEELREKMNTVTKYFTFDIDGLTIGQLDNPYKIVIDNDGFSMYANDERVMWIENGKVYSPEVEVSKGFKILGYLIDKDSNGNVNCAYVGG